MSVPSPVIEAVLVTAHPVEHKVTGPARSPSSATSVPLMAVAGPAQKSSVAPSGRFSIQKSSSNPLSPPPAES